MSEYPLNPDWEILFVRFVTNDLTAEQLDQLHALLREKPELAETLQEHLYQEHLLHDIAKGRGDVPDDLDILAEVQEKYSRVFLRRNEAEKSVSSIAKNSGAQLKFLKYIIVPSALCVLLFVSAVVVWTSLFSPPTHRVAVISHPTSDIAVVEMKENLSSAVAVTKLASNVIWSENSDQMTNTGDILTPGWLRLSSGLLVIEFFSGASVVIEGPAELNLISNNHAYCAWGRITADVPKQATGFRIDGPRMNVVDLGTSFSLDVTNGETTVNVIDGEIELHDLPSGTESLSKGDMVIVHDNGALNRLNQKTTDLNSILDVSQQALDNLAIVERLRQKERWNEFRKVLNADPSLLIHFDFNEDHLKYRKIANTSIHGKQIVPNGVMVNCQLANGRWQEKGAVEFRRIADRFRFDVPGEFTELTMATWIRVDGLDRMYNAIFTTDGFSPGEIHWHLIWEGEMELGVYFDEHQERQQIRSKPVITPDKIGEWVHLAVTLDTNKGEAVFYMDGQEVHRENVNMQIPIRFKNAQLGNWTIEPTWDPVHPIRHFSGAMEDFLFYSRALKADEIKALSEGQIQELIVTSH